MKEQELEKEKIREIFRAQKGQGTMPQMIKSRGAKLKEETCIDFQQILESEKNTERD